ncbi:uncharacterized protein PRCAT00000383001 [Priceomyces carsonii]|uniref:uncharacterized protein n=1 Tax=Priceomyces carsonii TaxID=28549 RepID=UPI002ED8A214|nr:unnamed protein product [Priceomyces carsonii]
MGVNSLWDIIGPTAKPVRLEALSRKRLAVDASIWIYQFLKAVRDSEGNSLPQSHIVGFFRRICKLLYHGIYPVFVFDGGAPSLKRETINQRRERRQGKRESAAETAQKLLAIQVQREAEKTMGRKDNNETVYLEDLTNLHPSHVETNRESLNDEQSLFRKKDEYHLPDINSFKVSSNDSRIMPENSFDDFVDDLGYVDGIDIDSVDPASPEFSRLPLSSQYMILSQLRLRSRLRMGFSKDQLEMLFPNSMDFSKFQIQQVQKRNFYTQRLMDVSGMGSDGNTTKRIAGDKDKKYALIRSENGWSLSLGSESSTMEDPILLDENGEMIARHREEKNTKTYVDWKDDKEGDSDVEFDDVPLENSGDDEIQKELIQSIYNQYREEEPINAEEEERNDLKKAIEDSKREYFDLQLKEEELAKEKSLNWNFGPKNQKTNKAEQDQGAKETSNVSSDNNKSTNTSDKISNIGNTNDFLNTNFGKSFLLQEENPDDMSEIKQNENNKLQEDADISKRESGRVESDIIEIEQLADDDKDAEKKKDAHNVLPSWFNQGFSSSENPHEDTFLPESKKHVSSKYQKDEDAGIVSWSEARELLNSEDELNSDKSDEVQEIAPFKKQASFSAKAEEEKVDKNDNEKNGQRKPAVLEYDFEEEDENNLVRQLNDEEAEHENFRSDMKKNYDKSISSINTSITEEHLLQEKLQKAKRDSDEVTETMIRDVQELLKRFGIPYITAPMEAEAQCAELLRLKLVDGIITDDSDCFLFGGDNVYKNMFNQKQYVEFYTLRDIEAKIGLTQDKLIELAFLLGSDYTEGIKGIGPVLAMEIIAEFGSLKKFKLWFDQNTKSRRSSEKQESSLKKNLLTRVKNGKLFLPGAFPDKVVFDAYKRPEVDHDKTQFKWGYPSLDQIRSFLMYNLRWSQSKVDEVMIPLIRDINRKKTEGTQSTISEFFPQEYIQTKKDIGIGKRLKSATNKLHKRRNTNNTT